MYNLTEYSDSYSKTSGSLQQYQRDEQNATLTDFDLFKFKVKIIGSTPDDGNTMDVKLAIPLKYLTNFWRTLEIPLSNCVINLNLICFAVCVTATGAARFAVTATRLYVPVVTLSTQDNTKLLQQLKSGFKRTSN